MSKKNSLLVDKSKMPLAMGIAFVAFTTQFGGGFASGAQIYQYFINYGIWCLILPILTQGLYSVFFWYGMRYAYKHKTYDYRSFSDTFYGKTRHVMSNLHEICYLIMIGTASAAAFATGGSTLETLFGIPYWLCTVFVAAFIFIIALFGTNVVRKCASTLSVLIIIGLVLVLVPNIIVQWDSITAAVSRMSSGEMTVLSKESGAFGPALWSAVLYFLFQLSSVSVMYQHVEPVTDVKQINRAAVGMFICNFFAMELSIVGLLAVAYVADLATASVPMLVFPADHSRRDFYSRKYDLGNRYQVRKRGRKADGFSGKKAAGPFGKECGIYPDLYLPGLCHRPVRTDDSSQQRLCVSGLCGFDYFIYSFCTSLDHDKGKGNLNIL